MSDSLQHDIYTIKNRGSGTFADLSGGSDACGAQVHGWNDGTTDANTSLNQRWLISPVAGLLGVYTIQNVHTGTFVDLSDGRTHNGTKIHGWKLENGKFKLNQQWAISRGEVDGFWRLQSKAGGTYMNLNDGNQNNGTPITGWEHVTNDHQLWTIESITISGVQVNATLVDSVLQQSFVSFFKDTTKYIVIPSAGILTAFQSLGMPQHGLLSKDLDYPAYALKAAVLKRSNNMIRVDGFPILFGIAFGMDSQGVAHAKNWSIQENNTGIVFFDPTNGLQSSSLGLDQAHYIY